jgi:5-hydroxyisourate hydrolase-like protein (transthyretin family)
LALLSGMSLAQGPEGTQATAPQAQPPDVQIAPERPTRIHYWLVLDPAHEVDEVLPPLLNALSALQSEGQVARFDPTPRRSDPAAVPCVRVMARPEAYGQLRHLPGVLDIVDALPPPPPTARLGVLAVTGSISGVVTNESSGQPLSGVDVNVYDAVSFAYLDDQDTDANGRYVITVSAPYSQAKLYAYKDGYTKEWYDDKPYFSQADAVALQAGATVTNVNMALEPAGVLSLTLALDGGGAPPPNVGVSAYDAQSGNYVDGGSADANGQLALSLVSGSYKLQFQGGAFPGVVSEWYSDTDSMDHATPVTVTSEMTTQVTAQVTLNGVLSVTLALDGGGAPPPNVGVYAYDAQSESYVKSGSADANGQLAMSLASGVYKLRFSGGDLPGIVGEWYSDTDSWSNATPITIASEMTAEVTAQVTLNGVLSGTVTDESNGVKLAYVYVDVYDAEEQLVGSDWTGDGWSAPLGQYQIRLTPGTYRIVFEDSGILYQSEWYSDANSFDTADWVTITGGVTTTADAALTPFTTGIITGLITHDGGQPLLAPLDGVDIMLYDAASGDYGETIEFYGDGSTKLYAATVPAGEYKVLFRPWQSYHSEWYSNANSFDTADVVTVTGGGVTPDINADLATSVVAASGCISGTLTSNGAPVQGSVRVYAYRSGSGWSPVSDDYIDASDNGVYQICHLWPGEYVVSFSKFPSATTWYSDTLFRSGASTVTVTANITTPDVNGTLDDLGACISGQVVDVGGRARPNAGVGVYDADGNPMYVWQGLWGTSFTNYVGVDGDGGFVACGLQPGTYTLRADDGPLYGYKRDVVVSNKGQSVNAGDVVIGRYIYLPLVLNNSSP